MITYEKLWDRLNERGISQYYLIKTLGISPSQITRLRHNRGVNTHTLNNFCTFLDCGLDDIAEFYKDGSPVCFHRKKKNARRKK